ncbi:pyocin activator PrtN family protein [Pectobacterium carotovorum]|uniref:pyocin activator PrtN family protein n=1 Tax=Pectobacterium TaxID=122277 RepID=UPI000D603E5C|nr:pyocin activator PrtN family protein [Pectobacterium polaris]MCU1787712.1 pyocin activator protein PrtN [Pectobacterium polaris]PWD54846.1 pyocin activator protein PrtN [Pectobacterium polaris]
MNTMFLLMAEFNSATVPLADISEKYFGLKPATAEKKALIGELPIPTFRGADSQKSPRMVHIQDLANHLDKQREKGKALFQSLQASNQTPTHPA